MVMPCSRASLDAFRLAAMMSGAAVRSIWMARPSQVRRRRGGPLVSGDVDGDRAGLPVPGGAAPAGEGRADGRAPAAGERGSVCRRAVSLVPVSAARCLMSAGCGWPVAARSSHAAARAANQGGRQAVMALAGSWLAAAVRQVGGDRLAAERGGAERERPGTVPPRLRGSYGLPFPAGSAGGGDAVPAQLAGERGVAAGVAEGGGLAMQARAAQMRVVGGALADVGANGAKEPACGRGWPGARFPLR